METKTIVINTFADLEAFCLEVFVVEQPSSLLLGCTIPGFGQDNDFADCGYCLSDNVPNDCEGCLRKVDAIHHLASHLDKCIGCPVVCSQTSAELDRCPI
jgi:hypothetical protein